MTAKDFGLIARVPKDVLYEKHPIGYAVTIAR